MKTVKLNYDDVAVLPNGQSISLETITAKRAEEWLGTSIGNRPAYSVSIAQMVQDMKEGKWSSTAKPIYFDENGALMEGHHRLTGIARFGGEVKMLVVRGFPRADWDRLNRDRKWSVAAYAAARNIDNAVLAMAAVKVRECLRRGLPLGSLGVGMTTGGHIWNNEDFVDLYAKEFGTWETDIGSGRRWGDTWYGLPGSIAAGVTHHLVHDLHYERSYVSNFFSQLYTLEGITKTVRVLRNRLDKERNERIAGNQKANQNFLCLLVASAFEGYVTNVPKTKLQVCDAKAAPKFPKPIKGRW